MSEHVITSMVAQEVPKVSEIDVIQRVSAEVMSAIVIAPDELKAVVGTMVVGGHVLLDGDPGTGKTAFAKALASSVGGNFRRIQGSPDLMPGDIIGNRIWNPERRVFEFHKGPIFANVVLADEINRDQPKTQSALLEAMGERQVTVAGEENSKPLPDLHLVVATHNPNEYGQGTFQLPKANVDRFMTGIHMEQDAMTEYDVLVRADQDVDVSKVAEPTEFIDLRDRTRKVVVSPELKRYIVALTGRVLLHDAVEAEITQLSGSRKNLQIQALARFNALNRGKRVAEDEDVHFAAQYVLPHRIGLKEEAADDLSVRDVIQSVIDY